MAAERGGGGDGVRRGLDGVRRGRGGECQAASEAGQLSVPWTPWRTAAVVSCASAHVSHLGRRTALSLFSYLTPHTRGVLGGGWLCGAHRQAFACLCMRGRGRKLVAIQTEAHARCVICALILLGVAWPAAASNHVQGIATARSGQRQDRIRHFLLSCSRPAAT